MLLTVTVLFSVLTCFHLDVTNAVVRPEFNQRLSQMAPKSGHSSSSGFTWVPVPTNSAQQNSLMYTYPFGYVTSQDQSITDDTFSSLTAESTKPFESIQPVASVTSYAYVPNFNSASAGSTSEDLTSNGSTALSFSAVGLISFLFFLRLIQDTLGLLNGNNGGIGPSVVLGEDLGKRNKRSELSLSISDIEWINMADDMHRFYIQLSEEHPVCRLRSLCQVNMYLADRYRHVGRRMGFLLSEAVENIPKDESRWNRTGQNPKKCKLHAQFCSPTKLHSK